MHVHSKFLQWYKVGWVTWNKVKLSPISYKHHWYHPRRKKEKKKKELTTSTYPKESKREIVPDKGHQLKDKNCERQDRERYYFGYGRTPPKRLSYSNGVLGILFRTNKSLQVEKPRLIKRNGKWASKVITKNNSRSTREIKQDSTDTFLFSFLYYLDDQKADLSFTK